MFISICDDDVIILEQLQKYLKEFFTESNLAVPETKCYSSGVKLLSAHDKPDIVFLDIEMPGLNGIFTGKELKQKNPDIIIFIITSYPEYLDDAMSFNVFRYLSKPLDKQRLFKNLRDAIKLYNSCFVKVVIEVKQKTYIIPSSDIVLAEADGHKCTIHTTSNHYETANTIHYWLDKLNMPCFFQTHRSFIINFKYVSGYDHFSVSLYNNKFKACLARRKYNNFREAYLLYLESTR